MPPKLVSASSPSKKFSISLRWLMALGFGGLVALAVGLVLSMSIATNLSNTYSLLASGSSALLHSMERSIRAQTDQAERTLRATALLYQKGELNIGNLDTSQTALITALMTTSPVIEALLIFDKEGNRTGVFRTPEGIFGIIPYQMGDEKELKAIRETKIPKGEKRPVWGEPIRIDGVLFHNVGFPLERNGEIEGFAIAGIGQSSMNKVLATLGQENDTTAFVLSNGNNVIAHSHYPEYFKEKSSVNIIDFPDQALRQLLDADKIDNGDDPDTQGLEIYESGRGIGRSGYVFIMRELKGYSAAAYRLGAYFGKAEIGTEIRRIIGSAVAGLAALLLAVLASFFISQRMSKPMKQIADVASDFSNLKLDNFSPLPASKIREIDDQTKAMNSMHTALAEFSQYVPRPLVKRLMSSGSEALRSVEREVTIMFADIVGFTAMSEELNATETASMLNKHFDMVCGEIGRHNGTVDKFVGDGIMAFWGAPDADDEHAKNALKSAYSILDTLETNNRERQLNSLPPLRLRIGIHTGRVVVGNIGSCDRHNYTVVGDTVNVANRLEQLGREYIDTNEFVLLVSSDTWKKAGEPSDMKSVGLRKLRGRGKMIEVYASTGSQIIVQKPSRSKAG